MIHVQSSIEIPAPPAEVFRLLCDPERKTRLNPAVELLHVVVVTPAASGLGSRVFYSLRTAHGVRSFHCEVTAFESNRLIEWVSDSLPPFRVRQRLESTADGCRLIHDEWLSDARPPALNPPKRRSLLDLARAFRDAAGLDLFAPPAASGDPDEALRTSMLSHLGAWLGNIKIYFEQLAKTADADPESTLTLTH